MACATKVDCLSVKGGELTSGIGALGGGTASQLARERFLGAVDCSPPSRARLDMAGGEARSGGGGRKRRRGIARQARLLAPDHVGGRTALKLSDLFLDPPSRLRVQTYRLRPVPPQPLLPISALPSSRPLVARNHHLFPFLWSLVPFPSLTSLQAKERFDAFPTPAPAQLRISPPRLRTGPPLSTNRFPTLYHFSHTPRDSRL